MNRHVQEIHEKNKLFKCNLCNSTFTRKYNCRDHLMKKHNSTDIKSLIQEIQKESEKPSNVTEDQVESTNVTEHESSEVATVTEHVIQETANVTEHETQEATVVTEHHEIVTSVTEDVTDDVTEDVTEGNINEETVISSENVISLSGDNVIVVRNITDEHLTFVTTTTEENEPLRCDKCDFTFKRD